MAIKVTLTEHQPKAGSHNFGGAEGQQALTYRLLEDNLIFSSRVSLVAHKNREASVVKAKVCWQVSGKHPGRRRLKSSNLAIVIELFKS